LGIYAIFPSGAGKASTFPGDFPGAFAEPFIAGNYAPTLFVLEVFGADHFRGEESLGSQIFYNFWRRTSTLPGSGEGNFGPGG